MVIRATRRSNHFQGKGSTFISQSSSFLHFSETLSIGPVPRIEPATSRSAVKRSIEWANPAAVKAVFKEVFNFFQVENSLGLPSVMLWRPIQSQKTLLFINLLIRTQLTTLTSLRNCNKKVQCIFFDEMYQHIDAKKLSFRLKAEGVLVDQKEGKHYKKTKFKQTYESSLSTVIIKNQSLPLK